MSNRIFIPPSGPGPYGSWQYPLKKTPMFQTLTQAPVNLRNELRISLTPYPVWLMEYNFGYLKGQTNIPNSAQNSALAYILGHFGASLGTFDDWLLVDPFDSTVATEPFGIGDGATTQFQLIRSVNNGAGYSMADIIQNPLITGIQVAGSNLPPLSTSGWYAGMENLLLQSQAFNLSPWTVNAGLTISPGLATAPDGTVTADGLYSGNATSSCIYQIVEIPTQDYVTFSIYILADPTFGTTALIQLFDAASQNLLSVTPSVLSGPAAASGTTTVSITGLSTSVWTRLQVTTQQPVVAGRSVQFVITPGSSAANTNRIVAWGAQVERMPNAGNYLATTTAGVQPNGIVTFRAAPAMGAALTWTGSFYYRCHFDEDQLSDLQLGLYQIWELSSLKFRSVILGDV